MRGECYAQSLLTEKDRIKDKLAELEELLRYARDKAPWLVGVIDGYVALLAGRDRLKADLMSARIERDNEKAATISRIAEIVNLRQEVKRLTLKLELKEIELP